MCELILSDAWQFLCNFLEENDNKINSKTDCQINRTGFRFQNRKLDFWFSINIPIDCLLQYIAHSLRTAISELHSVEELLSHLQTMYTKVVEGEGSPMIGAKSIFSCALQFFQNQCDDTAQACNIDLVLTTFISFNFNNLVCN